MSDSPQKPKSPKESPKKSPKDKSEGDRTPTASRARSSSESSTDNRPTSRRVVVSSPSQLPNSYSLTPRGILFSTTPGGSKIVYDRNTLLSFRKSPLAKVKPKNLPDMPGVTVPEGHFEEVGEFSGKVWEGKKGSNKKSGKGKYYKSPEKKSAESPEKKDKSGDKKDEDSGDKDDGNFTGSL